MDIPVFHDDQHGTAIIVAAGLLNALEIQGKSITSAKIVVAGGLHPGQSTNATSAQIAEKIYANMFINATDVVGIYNADPNKYKNAKLFRSIGIRELQNMIVHESTMAGAYDLMDILSSVDAVLLARDDAENHLE